MSSLQAAHSIAPNKFFETVACPLCSASTFKIVYYGNFPEKLTESFLSQVYRASSDQTLFEQVVQCTACGMIYLNPRLRGDLIVDSYTAGQDEAFIEQDAMRVRTFKKALRVFSKRHKLPLVPETKLLDIGCAGGAFLRAARSLGIHGVGIEPNKWLAQYAQVHHRLDVRSGTLADHQFPEASFDLITLWDVIEHVPQPSEELRAIHRLLKPGGLLVVNYPDIGSLPARFLRKKWPFLLSVHLSYYTRTTIRRHLKQTGFKTVSMRNHWQTLELGYVLKRATPYFAIAEQLRRAAQASGLGTLPLTYWIGQTQVVARRC